MKKAIIFSLLLIMASPLFAAMPYAPREVIAIHVGPKNPSFDESQFPDIRFFYTPKIKFTTNKVTGSPEALAKWFNKKGMNLDTAIVLDKNGIGAFVGFLMRNQGLLEAFSQGHLDTLGNVLREICEEGRESPFHKDTPLAWNDLSGMLGRRFPAFEVENASGESTTTTAVIYDDKLPKMVFIFRIPYDHKFKSAEQEMQDITSPLQALSGMSNIFVGDEYTDLLTKIGTDLYGR
jgi:hypothetical protein